MSSHENRRHAGACRFAAMLPTASVMLLLMLAAASLNAASPRVVITPAPGFSITWDGNNGEFNSPDAGAGPSNNIALASQGTTAFGSSELNFGIHFIANVNDGLYGNTYSWISDFTIPDPDPFIGLRFASNINVTSIAWGRDNGNVDGDCCGGTLPDRALGTYTLQYTTVAAPNAATVDTGDAATGWANLGTITYLGGAEGATFTSYLRHRFEIAQGGSPVAATGIRFKVPDAGSDIDEIEVNPIAAVIVPLISISPAAGFSITWDGNNGEFNSPDAGAGPSNNIALASQGTTAFGSSELNFGVHFIPNVNDGLYGNANSWISDFTIPDPDPFIGLRFASNINVASIAWGRDNNGGTSTDRALGVYRLQYTTVAAPDAATVDTGDAATGWQDIGTVAYVVATPPQFSPQLRHRFEVSSGGNPIVATGIRIKVPDANSDIDEIEVNPIAAPIAPLFSIIPAAGISLTWDGNDGEFNNPAVGAGPPSNRALASQGTTAFGSSELNFGIHFIANVNDGLYGNTYSWISDFTIPDPDPFVGLNFGGNVAITNIAWSRDNGNVDGDCCDGTLTGRALGTYTLQYTIVAAPDAATSDTGDAATGWQDIGTVTYTEALPQFTPHLRHRFDVSSGGLPLDATGLRIKVSDSGMDIDEIEVNTAALAPVVPALPTLAISLLAGNVTVSWTGSGDLEVASSVNGPWICVPAAVSPYTVATSEGTMRFYRIRQ